jgi:hypothetical protein
MSVEPMEARVAKRRRGSRRVRAPRQRRGISDLPTPADEDDKDEPEIIGVDEEKPDSAS